jgi:alpha-glucoside transport system permease protein
LEQIVTAAVAVVAGVSGILALLWLINWCVTRLPTKMQGRATVAMFVGPAFLFISLGYFVPTILTFIASFTKPRTGEFVGLDNYVRAISNPDVQTALTNSIVFWFGIGSTSTICLAIALAALLDQLKPRWEAASKSIFFMPMAVSAVAAAAVFNLIFAFRPNPEPQIGIVNAIVNAVSGHPFSLLTTDAYRLNTLLLILVTIWLGTGFSMVMISTAIKNVPAETIEAARLEGVGGLRIFQHVVFPQIWPTVITVFTTVALLSFQSFDVVFAMTQGRDNTDVIGNRFYQLLFPLNDEGQASAVVVLMLFPALLIVWLNLRQQKKMYSA